jgi:hypothetical protein
LAKKGHRRSSAGFTTKIRKRATCKCRLFVVTFMPVFIKTDKICVACSGIYRRQTTKVWQVTTCRFQHDENTSAGAETRVVDLARKKVKMR